MQRERKTFDVSKFKGLEIESFELEELSGEGELDALDRAGPGAAHARVNEQLIAESIVAVNGEAVTRPYVDWKKWNSRTRDFVRRAFHGMNSAAPSELEAFAKAAFGD